MADDSIRINESPHRLLRGEKAIINNSNQYEVVLPPSHLVFRVIDAFLARILPLFADDAPPSDQEHAQDLCRLLLAELELLPDTERYEAILATLTAHWNDPAWARVINTFQGVEDERYTIQEIHKGRFVADWSGNHVDAKCEVKQARKPFKQTNAQLATVSPHRTFASTLPRSVIRLSARKSSQPSLRDFSPTNPRLPAIKKATS